MSEIIELMIAHVIADSQCIVCNCSPLAQDRAHEMEVRQLSLTLGTTVAHIGEKTMFILCNVLLTWARWHSG